MRIDINGIICANDEKAVYEWFGYDAICPADIKEKMDNAKKGETIDVYINSGGGDIFAGSEIYSILQDAVNVKIHVVGLAASAASVILCAAESDITPTAMVMMHNVSSCTDGDYHAMDKESGILQKANKAIAAAYVAKTGMSESDALSMMDKETWLTAAEAVEKGIVDRIRGDTVRLVAAYGTPMLPKTAIEKIKNILDDTQTNKNADFLVFEKERLNLIKIGGLKK